MLYNTHTNPSHLISGSHIMCHPLSIPEAPKNQYFPILPIIYILKNVVLKLGQFTHSDDSRELKVIIINSINFVSKATVHTVTVCDM